MTQVISNSTIAAFVIAAIFTTAVPAALLIVLGIRKRISGIPLLAGAAAFFLSQIVLRLPLLNILSAQSWMREFSASFLYLLLTCFSAGLFEESARLGGALILKTRRSCKDAVSFGLGHGICEVVAVAGLTYVNNIVLCLAVNSGNQLITAAIPPETLEMIVARFVGLNPADVFWGILERVSAVLFHIFATVLVFRGVIKKKWGYYLLAMLAHTLYNLIAVLLIRVLGEPMVWLVEVVLLALSLAAGAYVLKSKAACSAGSMENSQ